MKCIFHNLEGDISRVGRFLENTPIPLFSRMAVLKVFVSKISHTPNLPQDFSISTTIYRSRFFYTQQVSDSFQDGFFIQFTTFFFNGAGNEGEC